MVIIASAGLDQLARNQPLDNQALDNQPLDNQALAGP